MNETLTSSRPMKGRVPVTIFTVLFIILAALGVACRFVYQSGWSGGSFAIDVPYAASEWIYVIVTLSVVVMFSIYVFGGQSKPSVLLPIVCGLYGTLEFLYSVVYEIEFGYDEGSWIFGFLMLPAFALVMVCALKGFNKKALFAIMLGFGATIYYVAYSYVLEDLEWYFLSFYNFMWLCGIIAPFAFFIALFIFGLANRTIDLPKPSVAPFVPNVPGIPNIPGVTTGGFVPPILPSVITPVAPTVIPPASVSGAPTFFTTPTPVVVPVAPVAPVEPVCAAPVQAAPVQAAPIQAAPVVEPAPAPVCEEKKATASPEQMLSFWKESFDKGMISEEEYKQKRDQIIRDHF